MTYDLIAKVKKASQNMSEGATVVQTKIKQELSQYTWKQYKEYSYGSNLIWTLFFA